MTQEHSDLIQHLLDGELDAMHEHSLFGQLAVDQDLRTELKQQLAIRNEVQHDRAVLLPPAHLTRALFAGIGAAAPIAIANSSGGFFSSMLAKIGVPVLAALSAAGITFWATSQQTPNTQDQKPGTEYQVPSAGGQVPTASQTPATASQTPATASQTLTTAIGEDRATTSKSVLEQRIAQLERDNALVRGDNAALREQLAAATSERDALAAWKREREAAPQQDAQQLSTANAYVATPIALTTTVTPQRSGNLEVYRPVTIGNVYAPTLYPQFLVQLRGFNSTSFTDVSVPTESSFGDNLGALLMYRFSDHHAFGVEFGSEAIPQSFEGTVNGQLIHYEQQPTTMWATMTYRYTFNPLGLGFSPFAQIGAGGTRYGPTGRATLGVQYEPAGPLTFIFGVEGSSMFYTNESTWYSTNKLGLTYGVALRF